MQCHNSLRLVARLKPDGSNEIVLMPQIPEGIVPSLEQLKEIFGWVVSTFDGSWEIRGSPWTPLFCAAAADRSKDQTAPCGAYYA